MTLDPRNAPILGQRVRVDPPRPVRLAVALLLVNVLLTAGYRVYAGVDGSFPLFLVLLLFAVWFAWSARAGRHWARTAATVLSCLFIAMMALLIDYGMVALLAFLVSASLLVWAMRLLWRSDVRSYFEV